MGGDLTFSQYETADAEALSILHQRAMDDGPAWRVDEFVGLLSSESISCFGHRGQQGEILSFMLIRVVVDEAEILTLCVDPPWRRKGLAKVLVEKMQKKLLGSECTTIHLEVAEDNLSAYDLYTSCGFGETGRRKDYYKRQDGKKVSALLMSKTLQSAG